MNQELPSGAQVKGSTPTFTRESLPEALCKVHALRAGRWGKLRLLEGSVTFVDLVDGRESELSAPTELIIPPQSPHKLVPHDGPLSCRVDFYELPAEDVASPQAKPLA